MTPRVVLTILSLTAVAQQVAIWNSTAGWMLAGTFALTTAAYTAGILREPAGRAA